MSISDTRRLGIEFERRVQTMIPEKEYLDKLDTETIYAYLNSYQDKYIHDIYRNLDSIPSGSKLSAHIESVLQSLIGTVTIDVDSDGVKNYTQAVTSDGFVIIENGRSVVYPLPTNFYMYIRSVSEVSSTYSFRTSDLSTQPIRVLPNELVSQSDIWRLIETPHNSLRILRYPAASLGEYTEVKIGDKATNCPTLHVIYDQYTTPVGIKVMYYKQPQHFDLMTSTPCELPMDAFDDLVTGAVDLYVQYVAGAEARRKQQQEEARKRAREDQRDARRSGGNQDEQS